MSTLIATRTDNLGNTFKVYYSTSKDLVIYQNQALNRKSLPKGVSSEIKFQAPSSKQDLIILLNEITSYNWK